MAFDEVRFPDDIAYGSRGGPGFSTDIVTTRAGFEQRNANWSQARARFEVSHAVKTQAQLDALIAFFRARQGRARGFRFKDWMDYHASGELLGMGDGETASFALVKRYASGGAEQVRRIAKPVAGTVQPYLDGVAADGGYSVDHAAGIVAFDVPPPVDVAVTADFEFDVPVRFDSDALSASLDDFGVHSWRDISLVELRA